MATKVSFLKVLRWSDDQCREYLERMRWPDGPRCPKCGADNPYKITRRSKTKNAVRTIYCCRPCKRQFTATVGTIFEDSKVPLNKWFAAIYLMSASKKGISAHQLHRQLDITYKSAWFMCHRVREAMREKDGTSLVGTIEADETYVGGKRRSGHPVQRERIKDEIEMGLRPKPPKTDWRKEKAIVFGILERGGRVRTVMVDEATARRFTPLFKQHVDLQRSHLITDGHPAYRLIRWHVEHDIIDHEIEYVRGDVHTQGIENYWSLLKRGIVGVFHHVGRNHLPEYLDEFQFRFNRRKISDAERFASLMGQTQGRVLWFCQTPQPANPHA